MLCGTFQAFQFNNECSGWFAHGFLPTIGSESSDALIRQILSATEEGESCSKKECASLGARAIRDRLVGVTSSR